MKTINLGKAKSINFSIIISIATLIVSFLTSFIFTKYLLSQPQIGDINYGLKSTVDSFTSFVSIFTFGMSSTFIRFHKKYKQDEKTVFSSFNVITSSIAFLALIFGIILVILTANNLILNPADGVYTQEQVHDFMLMIIISICYLALSIVLGNNKWFLESSKHIVLIRFVNLLVVIGYPIIGSICVSLGANMVIVTLVYSVVYLCGFISYLFVRIKLTKSVSFLSYRYVKKSIVKEIIFFSFFVVIACCVETFNHSVDKLILTIGFTAQLTTFYQLSMTFNQVLLSLSDIIYAPYFPYLAEDIQNGKKQNVQNTYNKVNLILLILAFLLLTGFVACGREFINIWLGDGYELVYYFTIIIFIAWPLYMMVKFSTSLQRLYSKHVKSSFLYIGSFILHLIITFSLVFFIDAWACIIGTSVSMAALGISFIFYNKKELDIDQKNYLFNFLKLTIISCITIGMSLLIDYALELTSLSDIILLLLEGALSVLIFAILLAIIYQKQTVHIFKRIFSNDYSMKIANQCSYFEKFKQKCIRKKDLINKLYPITLIVYFALNFSIYYLGGIEQISSFVSSVYFSYAVKGLSYLSIFIYSICFILANSIQLKRNYFLPFIFVYIISIFSIFVVPKSLSYISVNEYNWTVETTFEIGIFDLVIGNINFLIDLFVMFMYLFVFSKKIDRKSILVFLKFIVFFTIVECVYSFIFQYNDYLYFFKASTGGGDFNGYVTNLSGTFSSKNGFGFLLFQATIASFFIIFVQRKRRWLYWSLLVIITIVNAFSLCKTSLIAAIFVYIGMFIYLIVINWNRKRSLSIVLISITALLGVAVGILFTPFMRSIPFIDSVVTKFEELFVVSGDATISSRITIWEYALKLLQGPLTLFGYGRSASSYFLYISSNMTTQTFHNGLLDILCGFGVFGLALYIWSIFFGTKNSIKKESNQALKTLLILVTISTLLYGLMENVYLFMTSSCTMMTSSVILSTASEKRLESKAIEVRQYEIAI